MSIRRPSEDVNRIMGTAAPMTPSDHAPDSPKRLWPLLLSAWLLTACEATSTARIETAEDLRDALLQAGARVSETALMPYPLLGVPAWTWQVNRSMVTVYEFDSQDEREQTISRFSRDALALDGLPLMWSDRPTLWSTGRLIVLYVGTDGATVVLLDGLLGDPANAPAPVLDEPYPPSIAAAIAFLAERMHLDPGTVSLVLFEEAEWPNACLGAAAPGEECAQAVTPGWRVVLQAGGETYELRTDAIGAEVRLP
jgi:hypothetical protein